MTDIVAALIQAWLWVLAAAVIFDALFYLALGYLGLRKAIPALREWRRKRRVRREIEDRFRASVERGGIEGPWLL